MALWVRVALVLVCVGCVASVAAEPRSWSRTHGRHRSRASSHRRRTGSRRPSVPETVYGAREDSNSAAQIQRLWNQWMNGPQSDQPKPKLSAFSLKQQLATRAGVNQLRRQGPDRAFDDFEFMNDAGYAPDNEDLSREVMDLFKDVPSCKKPVHQLVRVLDVHPSTSAVYVPASVPLRRCSDQIACCTSETETCASSANVTIQLAIMENHVVGGGGPRFRYLNFVEDTECRCMPKTKTTRRECLDNMPMHDASDVVGPRMGNKNSRRRSSQERKPSEQTCRCTSEFSSRTMPDGSCKCDCFDSNRKCKRQRRGMTNLSETDNRCIVRGNCEPPDCKYDKYEKTRGRCPRKKGEWRRQRFVV